MYEIFWEKMFQKRELPCLIFSKNLSVIRANDVVVNQQGSTKGVFTRLFSTESLEELLRFLDSNEEMISLPIFWKEEQLSSEIQRLGDDFLLVAESKQYLSAHNRKMIQIGELMEEVFHSIRNPLAVIRGRVDLLSLQSRNEKNQRSLDTIAGQCQKIVSLLNMVQMISFQHFQSTIFQMDALVESCLQDQELNIAPYVQGNLSIRTDQGRIKIILESLFAIVEEFGQIQNISVLETADLDYVEVQIAAMLSFEGVQLFYGLESNSIQNMKRFGLKSYAYGLKLGLKDCNASLFLENNKLILRCPRNLSASDIEEQRGGSVLKILVVDDDQMLRETLVGLLSFDGHSILTMNSAEEALKRVEQDPDIDIILMDIRLPQMSGLDFLKQIEQTQKEYLHKTILISGMDIDTKYDVPFLRKPFSKARLTETIQQLRERNKDRSI